MLWFDVKLKRYSTISVLPVLPVVLWFDVKLKRYSTGDWILSNID